MQNTPNYNYNLPEYSDSADIAVLNANFSSIDANEYRIEGKLNALGNDIALPYDNTATYSVGDYAIYNNALYRCITAIATAEDFDSTKWTAITIGGELKSHDTRISTLEAGVDLEKSATNSFDDGIDSLFKKVVSSIVPVQAGSGTPSPINERAISGFTECTVLDISDSTNASYFMGLLKGTYGFVDLGTKNWEKYIVAEGTLFRTTISGAKLEQDVENVLCENYPFVLKAVRTDKTLSIPDALGYIDIIDDDYTTASDFKTAMNGVYLIYELATPTTPTITDAQFQTLLTAFGYNGSKATISFGSAGTVYDARVGLISGKLVVDSIAITLTGTEDIQPYTYRGKQGVYFKNRLTTAETRAEGICSHTEVSTGIPAIDNYMWVGVVDRNIYWIGILDVLNTDIAGFTTWLSNNNVTLVYKTTPRTYQLTPTQLRSLVGTNNLTSSTGEVTEVEYITNKTIAWLLDLIRAQEV